MSPLRKITREAYLLVNVPPPSSLTALCPIPTCSRVAAETTSPPSEQREWRRCSSPLLLVLPLCAAPQADAMQGGRRCTGTVQGAFDSKSPGTASLRISGEQLSTAAWEVPAAEILNIQARLDGLIQGWEIIKRSALCCLCLSLLQYFLNGWVVPKDTSCLWNNF